MTLRKALDLELIVQGFKNGDEDEREEIERLLLARYVLVLVSICCLSINLRTIVVALLAIPIILVLLWEGKRR